jgi:hypothetical protein
MYSVIIIIIVQNAYVIYVWDCGTFDQGFTPLLLTRQESWTIICICLNRFLLFWWAVWPKDVYLNKYYIIIFQILFPVRNIKNTRQEHLFCW